MSETTQESRADGFQAGLPRMSSTREKVYAFLRVHAPAGFTADEICVKINLDRNDVRSRLTELADYGRIVAAGRRPNAKQTVQITVWALPMDLPLGRP